MTKPTSPVNLQTGIKVSSFIASIKHRIVGCLVKIPVFLSVSIGLLINLGLLLYAFEYQTNSYIISVLVLLVSYANLVILYLQANVKRVWALAEERSRAAQTLETALQKERKQATQAFETALQKERSRAAQTLETALQKERKQATQAFETALQKERSRAAQTLETALQKERHRAYRSLRITLQKEREQVARAFEIGLQENFYEILNPECEVNVYQMGKVGSYTITKTLQKLGCNVRHFHYVDADYCNYEYSDQSHDILADNNPTARVKILNSTKTKIITLTRDPVARNISAFFHNLDSFVVDKMRNTDVGHLTDLFLKEYDHNIPLRWFDAEFKENTGINVYEHIFPKSRGYQIIEDNGRRVLVVKVEIDDQLMAQYIQDFLQIPDPVTLHYSNQGSKKEYKDIYDQFLATVTFPEEYLTKMYQSKYVKHFYSDSEIDAFIEKWSKK